MAGVETAAQDWVTLSLPLTATGAKVLLASVGLAVGAGLVWLMLNAPDRGDRRRDLLTDWLAALGWVLLPVWFVLLGGTLWHLWLLFSGMESFLDNVGFGMGAVVAAFLGGPFVIWGTVLKQQTVEFQKEGHITDRISKAVEQLGAEKTVRHHLINSNNKKVYEKFPDGEPDYSRPVFVEATKPNIEVRIGGLLSLERIAQDSTRYDKGRDHVRVMEILCAYVRENAPASEAKDSLRQNWESETAERELPAGEIVRESDHDRFCEDHDIEPHHLKYVLSIEAQTEWSRALPAPRADIAMALRIIGRRDADQRQIEARWGPEASDTAKWVFDEDCPELPEPPEGKRHGKAALDTYEAALSAWKEKVRGYRGYRPDLRKTNLQKADLGKLTLSGANLAEARMEGAVLWQARMEGADLTLARMEGADLTLARMDATTDLTDAVVASASVRSVDYTNVALSQAQINGMFGDASVTLPEGRQRPEHWPTWELPLGGEHGFDDEWRKWQADPEGYEPPDPPG